MLIGLSLLSGPFFLVLSSEFFPWPAIQHQFPILENTLQFPARLTIMAYPLLLCGLSITLSQLIVKYRPRSSVVVGLASVAIIFCAIPNLNNMVQRSLVFKSSTVLSSWKGITTRTDSPHKVRGALNSKHPGKVFKFVEKRHPDYLPVPPQVQAERFKRTKAYEHQVIDRQNEFNHQVLSGGRLELTWNTKKTGTKQLPLIAYRESQIKLNGQLLNRNKVHVTNIGALIVQQKMGKNVVTMHFKQPILFTGLLIVSIVAWIGMGLLGLIQMVKKIKPNNE